MQIAKKKSRTTSKYAIAKYTQVFNTSNLLNMIGSQRTKTIFFFLLIVPVPVDPPQYYWPLLQVSRFLYSLNKTSQARQKLFSNISKVPSNTSKFRKVRFVAGCRFWRFLLVNQLPLSIMAVDAQYGATAPLKQNIVFFRHHRDMEPARVTSQI